MEKNRNQQSTGKPVASNDYFDVYALRPPRYGESSWPVQSGTYQRKHIDPRGKFAMACIERWAMVAAEADGEDSAGRQKLRRLRADELVGHAMLVAEAAFAAFEARGWVVVIPSLEEAIEIIKDRENSND